MSTSSSVSWLSGRCRGGEQDRDEREREPHARTLLRGSGHAFALRRMTRVISSGARTRTGGPRSRNLAIRELRVLVFGAPGEQATSRGLRRSDCVVAEKEHDPLMSIVTATVPDVAGLPDGPVVLYDGVCGLCARSVRWILRHEPPGTRLLQFAPLQGPTAEAFRARFPRIPTSIDSVVTSRVRRAPAQGVLYSPHYCGRRGAGVRIPLARRSCRSGHRLSRARATACSAARELRAAAAREPRASPVTRHSTRVGQPAARTRRESGSGDVRRQRVSHALHHRREHELRLEQREVRADADARTGANGT
jgi:hypothetical protein